MNALTIIATNRCRPEWRDLSPKKECSIRSARLGKTERPGALPGENKLGGTPSITDEELRERILHCLEDGRMKHTDLVNACGFHRRARDVISAMVREGAIITEVIGQSRVYEAAE